MVDNLIGAGGVIEVPFKNYFRFSSQNDSMDQTTPFTVASQSIDKLWAVPRWQTYANADAQRVAIVGKARSSCAQGVGAATGVAILSGSGLGGSESLLVYQLISWFP